MKPTANFGTLFSTIRSRLNLYEAGLIFTFDDLEILSIDTPDSIGFRDDDTLLLRIAKPG
eukprot:9205037-Karenia_brevis.AAC.1